MHQQHIAQRFVEVQFLHTVELGFSQGHGIAYGVSTLYRPGALPTLVYDAVIVLVGRCCQPLLGGLEGILTTAGAVFVDNGEHVVVLVLA